MKRRILVCGGRDYADYLNIKSVLDNLSQFFGEGFCIIHGAANGADSLAGNWAKENGVPVIVVPANWDYYKKAAGHIRNLWMIELCQPDLVIAFPGGRGTADMLKEAQDYGIDTYKVPQ